jgi:hypothetical protein
MYAHPTLFLATIWGSEKIGVIKNNPIKHTRSRTDGSHVKGVKPKIRERKLRSSAKWQGALKQMGIK